MFVEIDLRDPTQGAAKRKRSSSSQQPSVDKRIRRKSVEVSSELSHGFATPGDASNGVSVSSELSHGFVTPGDLPNASMASTELSHDSPTPGVASHASMTPSGTSVDKVTPDEVSEVSATVDDTSTDSGTPGSVPRGQLSPVLGSRRHGLGKRGLGKHGLGRHPRVEHGGVIYGGAKFGKGKGSIIEKVEMNIFGKGKGGGKRGHGKRNIFGRGKGFGKSDRLQKQAKDEPDISSGDESGAISSDDQGSASDCEDQQIGSLTETIFLWSVFTRTGIIVLYPGPGITVGAHWYHFFVSGNCYRRLYTHLYRCSVFRDLHHCARTLVFLLRI